MNVLDFQNKKIRAEKITLLTCYDAASARLIAETDIDCLLVGDSVSMVMHGYPNTTYATMEMMCLHTSAVSRVNNKQFIIADLPFCSYHQSPTITIENVKRLIQSGAHAVKLEGGQAHSQTIQTIINAGVPVMGHIGLTPQSIHNLGGNRIQGRQKENAEQLLEQAKALENAGCFAIVLECIPSTLAKKISQSLTIPTIGIGAGPHCDGQVLVINDMLGFEKQFKPKFLKHYADAQSFYIEAINRYHLEVTQALFPQEGVHTYEAQQ
jgi:3-methyl-2-oxobutanoate hydroxymethyltransferase